MAFGVLVFYLCMCFSPTLSLSVSLSDQNVNAGAKKPGGGGGGFVKPTGHTSEHSKCTYTQHTINTINNECIVNFIVAR